jgi:TetR/AcrR family transcriptional regulator, transcriptional repressor of bet genes
LTLETIDIALEDTSDAQRPRTAPKEVRRAQLIEATIACIAENGISGTTMAKVTRRAGLSVGIVSLHFENKDDLLTSTLEYLSEEVRATWAEIAEDETLGTVEKLRLIALASFDPRIFTPEKVAVWFAFFGEAQYRRFYRDMVERYDDERGEVIKAICAKLIATSENKARDPQSILDAIECFGDGLWLNAIVYPDDFTRDYCVSQVEEFLAVQFPNRFGVRNPASKGNTV